METLTGEVLGAIRNSPSGLATLDMLESLRLCGPSTLKTLLSRLNKSGRILRLKRGAYSSNPMVDVFAAAQLAMGGYIGFSSALYLHGLISEMPFVVIVVTPSTSAAKTFGDYEFRAVSIKEKAVGFERLGNLYVSTRAKTLFDCLYLKRYSIEDEKLAQAYRQAKLTPAELKEFDLYVERFLHGRIRKRFEDFKNSVFRGARR